MSCMLPLLSCWRIEADVLPDDFIPAKHTSGFKLPGADSLAGFGDLIGCEEDESESPNAPPVPASAPFVLPAMIPDAISGEAVLRCEIDFGSLRGDYAALILDHISGRGRVMLGNEQIAAFDSASASFRSMSEAFDLTASPCMLAADLTQALQPGRKETLSICFDDVRPAGISGPVMLRVARFGRLARLSVTPDAAQQTMTVHTQIITAHTGIFTLRVQPVFADGTGGEIRETAYRCEAGTAFDTQTSLFLPGDPFIPGVSYKACALKITLLYQQDSSSRAALCDSMTLMVGYPGQIPRFALPLTPLECMQPPQTLLCRLSDLHIPAVRLPVPAPDALYRTLTRAGICTCMPDNLPLRTRLERLPCASFSAERVGEYACISHEASAWQMGSMVQMPRPADPSLLPGELLFEITGREINPSDEANRSVLAWLRAVSVRMQAEAARQGRYSGALCAPGEWDSPDIADSLRTAFAPLHVSALPLYGAWWSSSRFSATIHAFVPSGQYTSADPLIAAAILEDEDGNALARLRAPCRADGGHIGVLEAQLPDHACVLHLITRLTLGDATLEESVMPVYVGERGPLEAAFRSLFT